MQFEHVVPESAPIPLGRYCLSSGFPFATVKAKALSRPTALYGNLDHGIVLELCKCPKYREGPSLIDLDSVSDKF